MRTPRPWWEMQKRRRAIRGWEKERRNRKPPSGSFPWASAGWGPRDGSAGPSELVSDYFVSHTDTIKSPQRNLFTAQRCRVGSAYLPRWNNCCDDRLCWEHGRACENKHNFWLGALESEPSWRVSDISLVQSSRSSNQFPLRSSILNVRRIPLAFSFHVMKFSCVLWHVVISKCGCVGSKRCRLHRDGRLDIIIPNEFSFRIYYLWTIGKIKVHLQVV